MNYWIYHIIGQNQTILNQLGHGLWPNLQPQESPLKQKWAEIKYSLIMFVYVYIYMNFSFFIQDKGLLYFLSIKIFLELMLVNTKNISVDI